VVVDGDGDGDGDESSRPPENPRNACATADVVDPSRVVHVAVAVHVNDHVNGPWPTV
jgi:hypothetical protein